MNPYSNDLRQKIVDAYKHNEGSLRVLARRFSVSLSFVRDLVKLEKTTGKVMAKPHAGGPARKISGANLLILRELVECHRDATLANLREMYVTLTRQEVSVSTVGLALRRMQAGSRMKCNTQNDGRVLRWGISTHIWTHMTATVSSDWWPQDIV